MGELIAAALSHPITRLVVGLGGSATNDGGAGALAALGARVLDASGLRCSIYADRPLGCRTFFCDRIRGPARQPVEAMDALQRRMLQLSEALDGEAAEPKQILEWCEDARRVKPA